MKGATRAVVFDAYGTLFDVHSVAHACEQYFPGKGAEFSRAWRTRQLEYSWLHSLMGVHRDFAAVTRSAALAAAESLQLPLSAQGLDRLVQGYERLAPFGDVAPALKSLRAYPRAILSNGTPAMLGSVVAHAGLSEEFERLISVEDAGIYKPHRSVYALVCKQLEIEPAAVAFVSSNFWDIAGAACFGFRTYWINRTGQAADRLGFEPVAVLKSLTELPAVLSDVQVSH